MNEAERLAEKIEDPESTWGYRESANKAAAELRRLSAINAELVEALEKAYLAGFNASSEGYNGEYPFQNCDTSPENDSDWLENRDIAIKKIKARQ